MLIQSDLKARREAAGLSRQQLADLFTGKKNSSRAYISQLERVTENGGFFRNAKRSTLDRLETILNKADSAKAAAHAILPMPA